MIILGVCKHGNLKTRRHALGVDKEGCERRGYCPDVSQDWHGGGGGGGQVRGKTFRGRYVNYWRVAV